MKTRFEHKASRLGILLVAMTVTAVVAAPRSQCWMTGGGSIFAAEYGGGNRITHGFQLDCVPRRNDTLQVNDHGTGWNFHLDEVTSAVCIDDPGLSPNPPDADFDTYVGQGNGICRNAGGEARRLRQPPGPLEVVLSADACRAHCEHGNFNSRARLLDAPPWSGAGGHLTMLVR